MADNKADLFLYLLERVQEAVDSLEDRDAKLLRICRVLADGWPAFDWVGFYLVDGHRKELVLGPYVGEATEHVRIPFGQGICGQVAETGKTLVVADVGQEANYLACSPSVRSEIVVPIFAEGTVIGQLDIDSHTPDAFGPDERAFVEQVAALAGEVF
jgi:L-methionine (R)-S-oxide reductase